MSCHTLPPGDLPDTEIEPASLLTSALAGGFLTTSTTWEALYKYEPMVNNKEVSVKMGLSLLFQKFKMGNAGPAFKFFLHMEHLSLHISF